MGGIRVSGDVRSARCRDCLLAGKRQRGLMGPTPGWSLADGLPSRGCGRQICPSAAKESGRSTTQAVAPCNPAAVPRRKQSRQRALRRLRPRESAHHIVARRPTSSLCDVHVASSLNCGYMLGQFFLTTPRACAISNTLRRAPSRVPLFTSV